MTELFFLRHGKRIDHALQEDPSATPILADYKPYDPSLASCASDQIKNVALDIVQSSTAFTTAAKTPAKKTIYIHFLPYLRCCQTADLLVSHLRPLLEQRHPEFKVRYQLLGDFALSEWIHDKMKNKPPFYDSNDAYQMYTPNIKLLVNRSCCSNFRPTNTLGHWNGHDLSYKDYQNNCREYFKKLLATYDKPSYINNNDIVVVISHGYFINNLLSFFVTHPIFDEIPEAKINYAVREVRDLESGQWVLVKDALDLFNFDDIDKTLNLETDIVYYKTNFIKRDELNDKNNNLTIKKEDKPRPSFKIYQTSESYAVEMERESSKNNSINKPNPPAANSFIINNPICPAAKDWSPQKSRKFAIKNEFKLKSVDWEVFKEDFDITKPPARPYSPEISPTSLPTHNNSVVDLSKLVGTDENYKPMKLKYSTTDEIPIEQLNCKVNSHLNLAQIQRSYPSSNNLSITDFPKFANKRVSSNNSFFPQFSPKSSNGSWEMDDESVDNNELNIIKEDKSNESYRNPLLTRSKSLKHKQELAMNSGRSLLALYQKQQQQQQQSSDEEEKFTLSFKKQQQQLQQQLQQQQQQQQLQSPSQQPQQPLPLHQSKDHDHQEHAKPSGHPSRTRSRKNSVKFVPSVLLYDLPERESNSTPVGIYKKKLSMFYNLDSEDSDSEGLVSSSDEKQDYMWFGQNRK